MAAALKLLVVALMVAGVAAETHHVAGGPDFNATAWLAGRRFTVGDQIRMECSGSEAAMVEVGGVEEFESCDVSNPIRRLGEAVSHVALEEEGVRYFTSSDPDSCRNGLKLPVEVRRHHDYDPDFPSPPYDPYKPDIPSPPHKPDVPYPPSPSAAARLGGFWFALSIYYYCYIGVLAM